MNKSSSKSRLRSGSASKRIIIGGQGNSNNVSVKKPPLMKQSPVK